MKNLQNLEECDWRQMKIFVDYSSLVLKLCIPYFGRTIVLFLSQFQRQKNMFCMGEGEYLFAPQMITEAYREENPVFISGRHFLQV